jgi:hypothetical protein
MAVKKASISRLNISVGYALSLVESIDLNKQEGEQNGYCSVFKGKTADGVPPLYGT